MPSQAPVIDKVDSRAVNSSPSPSKATSLIDRIPLKLVMMLASPYLAGRCGADAIEKAHSIYLQNGFSATLDILGEDSKHDDDCDAALEQYKSLIDDVAARPIQVRNPLHQMTISFKPSMFSAVVPKSSVAGLSSALDKAYNRIEALVDYGAKKGLRLTLEAEDHRWTDFHLDTYFALLEKGYKNIGTVIQSRLFRTKKDLQRFDERCRVRMVIGIYNEPAEMSFTDKKIMKEVAIDYSAELLARGTYVELASHDTGCVGDFILRAVLPNNQSSDRFEVQHLLGVPRLDVQKALVDGSFYAAMLRDGLVPSSKADLVESLAKAGSIVRLYLPYGEERLAGPYCRRRLKANPNLMAYGIKNVLGIK